MTRPNDGTAKLNSKGRAANSRKRSLSSSASSSSNTSTPSPNLFSPSGTSAASGSSRTSVETRSSQKRRQTVMPSSDESSDMSSPQPSSDNSNSSAVPQRIFVQRNVPAFLNKLYSMVNDPTTDNLIHWSKDGNSFIVEGHEEFAKSVLPRFYKHNTFASFVRQLNMYDFHKVPHLQQGVLISDSKHERWEFSNPNFQRGRPEMLVLVTRKRNRERGDEDEISLATLVKDITAIRKHQTSISNELHTMQRDNAVLWEETLSAREKHQRHQDVIAKILQLLTAVFASNDHNALGMIGAPLVPRQLIKEAASLAGMPMPDEESPPEKSLSGKCVPPPSSVSSSSPLDILFAAKRLYSSIVNREAAGPSISSSSAEGSSSSSSSLSTPSSSGDAAALATASTPTTSATTATTASKPVAAPTTEASSTPSMYTTGAIPQPHLSVTSMPYAMLRSIDDDPLYSSGSSSSGITDIEGGIQNCTQTMDSAARSVQAIAQDIEDLQVNVEALADDLGINPSQLMGDFSGYYDQFADDYSRLIASATQHDRKQLFELASNRYHHHNNHSNNGVSTSMRNAGYHSFVGQHSNAAAASRGVTAAGDSSGVTKNNNSDTRSITWGTDASSYAYNLAYSFLQQQLSLNNTATIAARRASSAASRPHRVPSPVLRTSVESSFCTTTAPAVSQQSHPAIVGQHQQQQHPALFPVPVPVPVAMMPGHHHQQQQQQPQAPLQQLPQQQPLSVSAAAAAAAQLQAQQVAAAQQFPVLPDEYMALLTAQAQQTYAGVAAAAAAAAANNNNNNSDAATAATAATVPTTTTTTTEMPQGSSKRQRKK